MKLVMLLTLKKNYKNSFLSSQHKDLQLNMGKIRIDFQGGNLIRNSIKDFQNSNENLRDHRTKS